MPKGIDRNGTKLTALLRHLHERRRRRVLRRVARLLVELDGLASSKASSPPVRRRHLLGSAR
jgi:hypothetical protein